jgi:epsilon-lactone hydrolase
MEQYMTDTETFPASAQGIAGVSAIRAMLAQSPDDADVDLATRRANLAAFAAAGPPVETAEDQVAGVRVLRTGSPGTSGRIVYLHGGAYVLGSADTHARLGTAYANASGAEAVMVDYRLAPEHPFPAAIDDALAVWAALCADGKPTALVGDSAGGGLVLALAICLRDEGLPMPVALAVTSPWADLTLTAPSVDLRAASDPMLSRRGLALDADRYRGGVAARDSRVSPLLGNLDGLPPVMIQVGSDEILYDDAITLKSRLEAADVPVRLQIWQGMTHAWAAYGEAVPEAAASIAELGAFVAARLQQ